MRPRDLLRIAAAGPLLATITGGLLLGGLCLGGILQLVGLQWELPDVLARSGQRFGLVPWVGRSRSPHLILRWLGRDGRREPRTSKGPVVPDHCALSHRAGRLNAFRLLGTRPGGCRRYGWSAVSRRTAGCDLGGSRAEPLLRGAGENSNLTPGIVVRVGDCREHAPARVESLRLFDSTRGEAVTNRLRSSLRRPLATLRGGWRSAGSLVAPTVSKEG